MYTVWIYYERTWRYTKGECHQGIETCSYHVKEVLFRNWNMLLTAAAKRNPQKHLETLENTSIKGGGQIREKQYTKEHYPEILSKGD